MASSIELWLLAQSSVQTIQYATGTTTINSTSPTAISGISFTVTPQAYRVSGLITAVVAASGTTQPGTMRLNGTAVASSVAVKVTSSAASAAQSVNPGRITALNADPSVVSGAWGLSTTQFLDFDGIVVFSAAGTFYPEGRVTTSSSDADWVAQALSWMQVVPVVPA